MELFSAKNTLRVMALTRFHFISGLPEAGADVLSGLLAQNPGIIARSDTPAAGVMRELGAQFQDGRLALSNLDETCRAAMLRGALDAVYHARPLDTVIFDNNLDWLAQTAELSRLFPLSRFVFLVRDPSAIAAALSDRRQSGEALMAEDGAIGRPLAHLTRILSGKDADRVMLIDHDRLMTAPHDVLDLLYRFLRLPQFDHDVAAVMDRTPALAPPTRRVIALGGPSRTGAAQAHRRPVWFRMRRSGATMVLAGA